MVNRIFYATIAFLMISGVHTAKADLELIGEWGSALDDGQLTYHFINSTKRDELITYNVFAEWENKLDKAISFSKNPDQTDVDIVITYGIKLSEEEKRYHGELIGGITDIHSSDNGGQIIYAEIFIPTEKNDIFYENILKHEIGHVLGLGHSTNSRDLMSDAPSNTFKEKITECHIEAVLYINRFSDEMDC